VHVLAGVQAVLEVVDSLARRTFIAEPGSNFSGENVTFQRRADGRVISVLLVESTYIRLDQVPAAE
jgi:hypothetical protein